MSRGQVVSLVEKGWAGARQQSCVWAREGVQVLHVIRGRLPREVQAWLTPQPGMRLWGVPPAGYRWAAAWALLRLAGSRGPRAVLVDNARAARWVAQWFPPLRAQVYLVDTREDGTCQLSRKGQPASPVWP